MEETDSQSFESFGTSRRTPGKIRVTGEASFSVEADFAEVDLQVEALEFTVSLGRSNAAKVMTKVLKALSAACIADEDVTTRTLSIQPAGERNGYEDYRTVPADGFYVSNSLRVKLRDLEAVGSVIDDAVKAGGDLIRVRSISFGIDNRSTYKDQLLDDAVASATAKARRLAELTGVTLGKPTSISLGHFGDDFEMAYSQPTHATPIRAGGVEVSVNVSIEFAIG